MDRRGFLKLGLFSAAALSTVGIAGTLTGCSASTPETGWKILQPADRVFLQRVAPVMLKGALPTDSAAQQMAIDSMLINIDQAIFNLGPHSQKQMKDLFMLLEMKVTRGVATGIWSDWPSASDADIEAFLNRWRDSSLALLRLAYNGINKLMVATWYGQPASWQAVQYPGPPYADVLVTTSIQEK